jgi:nucleoid-associated protein YgaU
MAKIASQYKVPLRAIAEANHVENANLIYKGQKLCIPSP